MTGAERYLDLLAKAVTGELYLESGMRLHYLRECVRGKRDFDERALLHLERLHPDLCDLYESCLRDGRVVDDDLSNLGFAPTMIGRSRLLHIGKCLETVEKEGVPGDLIECGVWRGGAALFMRGWLAAYGIGNRTVWLADSFAGLPPAHHPEETEDLRAERFPMLAVELETVRGLFDRFGLLDEQVRFLPGWFAGTLPACPIGPIALLRIDADYHASTWESLDALYDRVSPGGFVAVDDYGCIPACRTAVDRFRRERGIAGEMSWIDWTGVCWRKQLRGQPCD